VFIVLLLVNLRFSLFMFGIILSVSVRLVNGLNFITVIGNRKKIENLGESCSPPGVMSVFNSREEMCFEFRTPKTHYISMNLTLI